MRCMFFVVYSFGMLHDGENNDCPADSDLIMDAVLSGGSGLYMWSSCSADFLSTFLRYFLCINLCGISITKKYYSVSAQ